VGVVVGMGGRAGNRAQEDGVTLEAARWLVDHAHVLPFTGDALDVASGSGRNAFFLAARGLNTLAVDRSAAAIDGIRATAARLHLPIRAEVLDLETGSATLPLAAYDVIVAVHYLHRPLFPALKAALKPGGMLVYETFTRAQAQRGRPTNPAFLLRPGELRDLVAPLEVLFEREGEFEEKMLASVIAVRPPAPSASRRR
jgi:SAM-dependent methyltransferase